MTKAYHTPDTCVSTAETIENLASDIRAASKDLKDRRLKGLEVNSEQKRRLAINYLADWISDLRRRIREHDVTGK